MMIEKILYLIIVAVWSSYHHDIDDINLIEQSLSYIEDNSNYDIIDNGYLIKNPNGSSQGNPGGGYGNFQFENNIITTQNIYTGISSQFIISSNDAVIFIGKTPPKCKYFSYVIQLCEELSSQNISNNDERIELFASLAPSLNHLLINTSTSSDSVFNQTVIIIFTASKKTYSDLYDIFSSYNLQSLINLVPIVSDYTNFSDQDKSTVSGLNVLLRVALPEDITAYTTFMNTQQTIYYISPSNLSKKKKKKRKNKYLSEDVVEDKISDLNINETDIYGELFVEYRQDVIQYMAEEYNMEFEGYFDFFSPYHENDINYWANYGWDCIDNDVNCASDNRDCYYSVSNNSQTQMLNNSKSFWLLVGVNHYETNQTTYSLFALWAGGRDKTYQVTNFEYGDKQLLSDIKYSVFYSVQFAKQENCLDDIAGFCIEDEDDGDITKQYYLMLARDYLNPTTKTRPNENELVKHILMKFRLS